MHHLICREKKVKRFKGFFLFMAVILSLSLISGCSSSDDSSSTSGNNDIADSGGSSENDSSSNPSSNKNTYGLGETFTFDDLEITMGSEISFTSVKNKYSDHYKDVVVRIPVTVKNLKDETHNLNMFYYTLFGSQGTELEGISAYFDEDCIDWAGELRSGASYTKYFYLLYDGDGVYAIEFDNWSTKITVEFNVVK